MPLTKTDTGYRAMDPFNYNAMIDALVAKLGPQPQLTRSQGHGPNGPAFNRVLAVLNANGSAFTPVPDGDRVFDGVVWNAAVDAINALPFRRCAAANNCALPTNYNTVATNWVHNDWTTHYSGPVALSAIDLYYVNGLISTNSEQNAYYDFNLNAGIKLGNAFTAADGGSGAGVPVAVSKNWGVAKCRVNVNIPANTVFTATQRRAATDAGVAGSYNVITTTSGTTFRQDGNLAGASIGNDYTLGAGAGYGAKAGKALVNAAGSLTGASAVPVAAGGQGYGSGLSLAYYFGAAGVNQPGSAVPGLTAPAGGYGVNAAGALSAIVAGSTFGTGLSASNPPLAFLGGGGGFGGANTASYGPSLITGVPASRLPSVLIVGDSIAAGYGSVDSMGDLNGSYGWYEQMLAGKYAVHKLCVSGESAAGWNATHAQQLNFIDYAVSQGLALDYVVIGLGTNDFLTNLNTNALSSTQAQIATIAALFQARGAKVVGTTVLPAVRTQSASNKFTTLAEQVPYNQNFVPGGNVEQYNAWAVGNLGRLFTAVIDGSSVCRDSQATHAFRVNAFGGTANAFCNDDGAIGGTGFNAGIHPNVGCGIPFLKANCPLPYLP